MLDKETRQAILRLNEKGHGTRAIARAVSVSRNAVRRVLASASEKVPRIDRAEKLGEEIDLIRGLYSQCEGNRALVKDKLEEKGIDVGYSTLTGFCRRHEIGVKPKRRSGQYHFGPAVEMQHDTSPHDVKLGGKKRRIQCASLVMCYSRMLFAQAYPVFDRFHCKVFLTDALVYMGASATRCMTDNTSVVIARGTGANAVPAPEMVAFSDRFGFDFVAHELGDANRSGRVERPFHFIEHNFYPARNFDDFEDLNRQLVAWCNKVNSSYKKHLKARPRELWVAEKPACVPLPIHVPEVYQLHHRIVDLGGYVSVHTNRYSVSERLIGRQVKVHETKDKIRVYIGHELDCEHKKRIERDETRITLAHHKRNYSSKLNPQILKEEKQLRAASPELGALVDKLKKTRHGNATRPIRQLHRFYLDYPILPLRKAVADALRYGLTDLERIERMVLRNIAGDFFQLPLRINNDQETKQDDGKDS